MIKSTITDLPKDIQKAVPHFKENQIIMEIIRLAQAGEFHCFKNTIYCAPKLALILSLNEANEVKLLPIIEAVQNGKYDETPDQEDKDQLKKDWLSDGGDKDLFNKLIG